MMPMQDTSTNVVYLSSILHQLSEYCEALRAKIRAVEDEFGANLSPTTRARTKTIKQVQGLDYVHQALEDLSTLAASLSRVEGTGTLPATTATAIRANLGLSDTQALMDAAPETELPKDTRYKAGHLDLF